MGGPTLCSLLEMVVHGMAEIKEVGPPSMDRYIVEHGYLLPLADEIVSEAELGIPRLTDHEPDIERRDPREAARRRFDDEVAHIAQTAIVDEVRNGMIDRLDALWDEVLRANGAFGEQVREMVMEMREVDIEKSRESIGVRGLLKRVTITRATLGVETRAVVSRKRGGPPECSPWVSTGTTVTRVEESAFESLSSLPELRGRLNKCSPSMIRAVFAVFNAGKQERVCILKDGHFLWWEPGCFDGNQEANGCINFLAHRAEVLADESCESVFTIRP